MSSEDELIEQFESSLTAKKSNRNKWKLYLFPFPKFAVLCLFSGFLLFITGLFLLIIGLAAFWNRSIIGIVPLLLGLVLLSISFITVKFGKDLWIESRPYWIFHTKREQNVLSPFRKSKI
ncbi:MAG: hypothetical protein ACFFAU_06665 [Candidatus Hodarchaeota archaeon]